MAKRRVKKRTHVGAHGASGAGNAPAKAGSRAPKSMVIRVGASEVGSSVSQLVKDVRLMMEPDTASRLKERRRNRMDDFVGTAGLLGVTHLLLFSRSDSGNVNLRLALTPRGPTVHFRVEKYSLCKDILQSMKRPRSGGNEYLVAPLLVMNNLSTQNQEALGSDKKDSTKISKHLETLMTDMFRSLFPPINPTTTPLHGIKRVLLIDRVLSNSTSDSDDYTLNVRHFAIETRTAKSVPKALRRLDAAGKLTHAGQKRKRNAMPNLGKLSDVSDYLLDPHAADGFTSGSDSEPETDAEVEVLGAGARKVQRRKPSQGGTVKQERRINVEKKGIKLHELGPRLTLRATKVEEGTCSGKVMWHSSISKTKEEVKEMDETHERRRQEKERRKAEQKANVERKKAEKKARGQAGGQEGEDEGDEEAEEDELLSDGDDDEWDDEEEFEEGDEQDQEDHFMEDG